MWGLATSIRWTQKKSERRAGEQEVGAGWERGANSDQTPVSLSRQTNPCLTRGCMSERHDDSPELLETGSAPAGVNGEELIWSTFELTKVPRSNQVSWYLQLAILLIGSVSVWAAWPRHSLSGTLLPRCGVVVETAWPTAKGFEGPTSSKYRLQLVSPRVLSPDLLCALSPAGVEAQAAQTAYPSYADLSPIKHSSQPNSSQFEMLHYFGNLSPWRSVSHGLGTDAQIPQGCEVEQVSTFARHLRTKSTSSILHVVHRFSSCIGTVPVTPPR